MAWVLPFGKDDETTAIARTLAAAAGTQNSTDGGLRVVTSPESGDPVGVIVCTTGDDDQLLTTLTRCAARGQQIVVVAPEDYDLDPWTVLWAGADEMLTWDDDPAQVLARIDRLQQVAGLARSAAAAQRVIGNSPALGQTMRDLVTAARFGRGPILILGETGTGKELAARVAHEVSSSGGTGHLVVVDCTTIVPSLSGSELFGHERGAFTGAVGARTGACAAANGGTLFLDEIGELALDLQPALLRLVQEGTYKRVGADTWQHSRFRLICATNRSLEQEVAAGRFRADLYYRIAASTVTLPPLRERMQDISGLFQAFLAEAIAQRRTHAAVPELSPAFAQALLARQYPGNLRDLRQLAVRVATRYVGGGPVTPGDLPPQDRPAPGEVASHLGDAASCASSDVPGDADPGARLAQVIGDQVRHGICLKDLRERVADLAIAAALEQADGNVRAAAALLGVTDRALHLRRQAAKTAS